MKSSSEGAQPRSNCSAWPCDSCFPELDSTLIDKLTDDKRSVVFDSAVRSVRSVCRITQQVLDAFHC